jgi:trimeric autotransporter adhesin
MRMGKLDAEPEGSRVDEVAIAGESISISGSQRARLMGASALAGGALRGLSIAAGMATAFGATPAAAQCASGATGNITTAACDVTAATGVNSTAVGRAANATGLDATAFGFFAVAMG